MSFRYVRTFGETEAPYFDDSQHLFAPGGLGTEGNNVWIAENMGRRALKYTSDGAFVMQIGRSGFGWAVANTTIFGLSDVAVDRDGNIWASDFAHHVIKFDSTGKVLKDLGQVWNSGTGSDRFNEPSGVAFDAAGNAYISDTGNHRVQVFASDGTYRATIGITAVPSADNTHFNRPRRLTVDSGHRLYVADTDNHRIQIFDVSNIANITYLATIGISGVSGTDHDHLNGPQGVAVDVARGRIYIADSYNWRIQVFDYATYAYQRSVSDDSFTDDVAVDMSGNLYLAKSWSDRQTVRQYDNNLNFLRSYGSQGVAYLTDDRHYNRPEAVAVTGDGSIYGVKARADA